MHVSMGSCVHIITLAYVIHGPANLLGPARCNINKTGCECFYNILIGKCRVIHCKISESNASIDTVEPSTRWII